MKKRTRSSQLDLFETNVAPSKMEPPTQRKAAPIAIPASYPESPWTEDRKLKCCGKSVLRRTHNQQPHIDLLFCQVEKVVTGNVYYKKEVIWGR